MNCLPTVFLHPHASTSGDAGMIPPTCSSELTQIAATNRLVERYVLRAGRLEQMRQYRAAVCG
jgi:hypothetical protein